MWQWISHFSGQPPFTACRKVAEPNINDIGLKALIRRNRLTGGRRHPDRTAVNMQRFDGTAISPDEAGL
jgi:hypothetical protein